MKKAKKNRMAKNLWKEISSDLYRYEGKNDFKTFVKSFFLSHLGFRISVYYRVSHHFNRRNFKFLARMFSLFYRHVSKKYGVDIPFQTYIGYGLYMPHPFTIVINPNCHIGNNCNLHHGVTIGASGRGENKGFPVIKDNIYLGPGAKIFGNITVESNCAVGANCVMNRSTEYAEVLGGIPAKVLSKKGSTGLLKNIYYE